MSNVAWGLFNLAVAYLLLIRVGKFDPRNWSNVAAWFAGFALMAFFLAHHFGPLRGGG
jgi:hypothetical protein